MIAAQTKRNSQSLIISEQQCNDGEQLENKVRDFLYAVD